MNEQIKHHSDKLAYETDSWDLKVALEAEEHIVVIDARSPQAFEQEHIPGAINIPHRNMSSESVEHLDKKALIVTYCDGIGCNASTKGALNMAQLGFRVKELIGGEANLEIRRICSTMDWQEWRTVPFLDPYGMQVEWQTLEAIAQTRAIDLWLLVPLGIAINRMLPNSGEVPLPWQRRLDIFFGTKEWRNVAYTSQTDPAPEQQSLFPQGGPIDTIQRVHPEHLERYFIQRLRSTFPAVLDPPLRLYNSRGSWLYSLSFAVANENPRPQEIAMRIARHIISRTRG